MSWDVVRTLTDGQQVAVLFVLLFGALGIASVVVYGRRLQTPEGIVDEERQARGQSMRNDLRAMWIGALVFWVAWASGPVGSTLLFGMLSFLALREFVTLTHTRRADHRALILAFFLILPVQYIVVANRHFDLFTVFVPVYVFLALPVVTALRNDPTRFLERTAKLQWGLMVCLYGMSHAPALLLLNLQGLEGRGAFLVVYLVAVVAAAQIGQALASRVLRRRPVARAISRSFSWRAWALGVLGAGMVGLALFWATPFDPLAAWALGAITGGAGTFGDFVMQALKRDAGVRFWGTKTSITGAVGLLDRVAALCFAAPVFFHVTRWTFDLQPG
jgi:phosphatidate cytidylyltransferase